MMECKKSNETREEQFKEQWLVPSVSCRSPQIPGEPANKSTLTLSSTIVDLDSMCLQSNNQ